MLFLNKEHIRNTDQGTIQNAVRQAYNLVLDDAFNMPDRMHVADRDNMLLLMPCFSEKYMATKLVSVFPDAGKFNQPAVNGTLSLCDNQSGAPLAFMNGAALTAERTGAVGGLAVDLLAPESVEKAGIFGAGVQGFSQVRYLLYNRQVKQLWIYDMYPKSSEKMAQALGKAYPELELHIAADPLDLVKESEVIIAATTTKTPLFTLPDDRVSDHIKSKTFISIGSFRPDMKEFPDQVIETADEVYVDTPFAAKESGDIEGPLSRNIIKKEKIQPFAPLVRTPVDKNGQTRFFKSVGMALFDLTVAAAVYEQALKLGFGIPLEL